MSGDPQLPQTRKQRIRQALGFEEPPSADPPPFGHVPAGPRTEAPPEADDAWLRADIARH